MDLECKGEMSMEKGRKMRTDALGDAGRCRRKRLDGMTKGNEAVACVLQTERRGMMESL